MPVDYAMGTVPQRELKYRDGVLLTVEAWPSGFPARPYAYLETAPGQFEHVAILETDFYPTVNFDLSGRTVVATTQRASGARDVLVYALPTGLKAPPQILNDFEDQDLSDFTFAGGQYALATRGSDDVLAQNSATGYAFALVDGSETSGLQRVEADIDPTYVATNGWVGLVVRYVDAYNYYFVAARRDGTLGVYRRLNGVNMLIVDGDSLGNMPMHVILTADSTGVSVLVRRQDGSLNGQYFGSSPDSTLRQGRAGVATFNTRADFDDVRFTATDPITLAVKDADSYGFDFGRPFTERGGNWQVQQGEEGEAIAVSQLDVGGYALATLGTPVESQDITSAVRLDAFGGSDQAAWFGLLARYVDASTYYYAVIRNSNQILIRKKVNGVITTLASASITAAPGQSYYLRFRVIGDVLQVFNNNVLLASAHDSEIKSGKYGIGMYRAAARWWSFRVEQP